jgi:hypothetical protein
LWMKDLAENSLEKIMQKFLEWQKIQKILGKIKN